MSIRKLFSALVGAMALVTAIVVAPASAKVHAAACTPLTNVEAIIDDSGSMSGTDPNVLRGQAVKLIITKQAQTQPSFTFGAVSFGDPDVHTLFAPAAVGANKTAMAGLIILIFFTVLAVAAPLIAPYGPLARSPTSAPSRCQPPAIRSGRTSWGTTSIRR